MCPSPGREGHVAVPRPQRIRRQASGFSKQIEPEPREQLMVITAPDTARQSEHVRRRRTGSLCGDFLSVSVSVLPPQTDSDPEKQTDEELQRLR
ncbi:hypothetical protein EYF80_067320 [Liparis tanakae]|uniref:Uncharacterized protein n=1 Tax=Liparis tanakae TaxID=230148 RepID=A0A4Z2E1F8_9TELE|nr:hypothetical protein EYF80_067320 [Liparis tanakae]